MARMTLEEIQSAFDAQHAELEMLREQVKANRAQVQPLIALFDVGRMLGKILFVAGGIVVGAATAWSAFSDFILKHWR